MSPGRFAFQIALIRVLSTDCCALTAAGARAAEHCRVAYDQVHENRESDLEGGPDRAHDTVAELVLDVAAELLGVGTAHLRCCF